MFGSKSHIPKLKKRLLIFYNQHKKITRIIDVFIGLLSGAAISTLFNNFFCLEIYFDTSNLISFLFIIFAIVYYTLFDEPSLTGKYSAKNVPKEWELYNSLMDKGKTFIERAETADETIKIYNKYASIPKPMVYKSNIRRQQEKNWKKHKKKNDVSIDENTFNE